MDFIEEVSPLFLPFLMLLVSHFSRVQEPLIFWIFHKGNRSLYCCWIGMLVCSGVERVQGFLFQHINDVTPLQFLITWLGRPHRSNLWVNTKKGYSNMQKKKKLLAFFSRYNARYCILSVCGKTQFVPKTPFLPIIKFLKYVSFPPVGEYS